MKHFNCISMTFPFWVMIIQPPLSTLLCAMLADSSTYCLLEGLKSFFDSMSIQLDQRGKTLSPVRPWQHWLVKLVVSSALLILALVAENIGSSLNMGSSNSSKVLDYFERHYRRFLSLRIYKIWNANAWAKVLCHDSLRGQAQYINYLLRENCAEKKHHRLGRVEKCMMPGHCVDILSSVTELQPRQLRSSYLGQIAFLDANLMHYIMSDFNCKLPSDSDWQRRRKMFRLQIAAN